MIEYKKWILGQTMMYCWRNAIIRAITFFMIPLYTKILKLEQFVDVAPLNYIGTILLLVLTLGLGSDKFKFYHGVATETEQHMNGVESSRLLSLILYHTCWVYSSSLNRLLFRSNINLC